MRLIKTIVLFLVCICVQAQDYEQVDATIQLYPETFENAEEFSYFITRDFKTEDEKVRAIYGWLINNIAYDPNEYSIYNYTFRNYRERNAKDEKLRKSIIKRTLKTGKAVCEGYAMVFERMCELQDIDGYLVWGDIKTSFRDIGRPFAKNHMWNIVMIDGKQFLFDATWGAGKYHNKFIKEPSYFWYKSNPQDFIKTHYPQLQEDTLIAGAMPPEAFSNIPLIIDQNLALDQIKSPAEGVLSIVDVKGGINFSIQGKAPKTLAYQLGNEKKTVLFTKNDDIFQFTVPVEKGNQDLLIFFDEKPALAYKIR